MSKPPEQGLAHLSAQLHHDLPLEPLTRVVNLAAVALGSRRSKSLQVGQMVTALPLAGIRASRTQRGQRFLQNDRVPVDDSYQPLAQRLLPRLGAGGARRHVTLDRTEGGTVTVRSVGVGWRGRALPVLGRRLGPGAARLAEQKALLAVVAAWWPQGARVLRLGDRELGTGVLAQGALQHGWALCLRLRRP